MSTRQPSALTIESQALAAAHPARSLEPLSDAQLDAIEAETTQIVARLLEAGALSAHTRRSYASALRYWDAWHHAAFDCALPLITRRAVPPATVEAFIGHHAPVDGPGGIRPAMPDAVRARLAQITVGRRQVHKKARGVRVADDVPSIGTVRQRVAALNAVHTMLKLPSPGDADPRLKVLLRSLQRVAAEVAPAMLRQPKRAAELPLIEAMLERCVEDGTPVGVRDAALLVVAFASGGRRRGELASMRWSDLEPMDDGDGYDGYTWNLSASKGLVRERADQGVARIRVQAVAAELLDSWRDLAFSLGASDTDSVWRRLHLTRVKSKKAGDHPIEQWKLRGAMDGEDIAGRVKLWAEACGADASAFAAHSLRSGAITHALKSGMDLLTAQRLALHKSSQSTVIYDQRDSVSGAAMDVLQPKRR